MTEASIETKSPSRLKDLAESVGDLLHLDPRKIVVEPGFNVRIPTEELEAHISYLTESIKQVGVQDPLKVRFKDGKAYLVSGHCRLQATKRAISEGADIKKVPCVQESRETGDEDRILSLVTDNSGMPLSPMEQAVVYQRLSKKGWTNKQIAERAGLSISHVTNLLNLAAAPAAIKQLVNSGKVSPTMANNAVRDYKENALDVLKVSVAVAKKMGQDHATPKHAAVVIAKRTGLKKLTTAQQNKLVMALKTIGTVDDLKEAKKLARDALRDVGL